MTANKLLAKARILGQRAVNPRWRWFTVGAFVVVATCVRLSLWQFDRLAVRTAAQALAAGRAESPPIAIDAPGTFADLLAAQPAELSALVMRRASVRGTFDHEHDEALTMQVVDGRLGVRLLSPLRLGGEDGAVLIDRGWLPVDYDRPVKWTPFRTRGPVTVEGRLRPGFRRAHTAGADRDDGLVADLDLEQIGGRLPYPLLRLVLVESPAVDASTSEALPIKRELQPPQADLPHLAYAVQWLAFAVIVAGGYSGLVAADVGSRTNAPRIRTLST
jgi:surfeit locus 1 family protein